MTDQSQRRSKDVTSKIMAAVRNRDSVAELALRRRLFMNGIRYRLKSKLPGKPDIVFPKQRLVVFVDGDLWHGNSWRVRGLPSLEAQFPNNTSWWTEKISRTIARDRTVTDLLTSQGWVVLRYWESDVLSDPNTIARDIVFRIRPDRINDFRSYPLTRDERRRLGSVRKSNSGAALPSMQHNIAEAREGG